MRIMIASLFWSCTARSVKKALSVPSFTEAAISLTTMAITRDSGPWFWAPQVHNVACGIQLIGVYDYLLHTTFKEGTDSAKLSGYKISGEEIFSGVKCAVRTAWQFADEKFGKDHQTASFAVACAVDLAEEIGSMKFNVLHETGRICSHLATNDVHLQISLVTNGTSKGAPLAMTVHYLSEPSKPVKSPSSVHESAEFVVCGVQSYRNNLTPFILPMWVQHYSMLGYRVALFDRYGLHSEIIHEHFPPSLSLNKSGRVDYYPHTMLDKALGRNFSKGSKKDFAYKVYYKEHLKAAQSINPGATLEKNTGVLDREKVVTYDHCRLLYAKARGILYVDTDEFLYCPSVHNSYAAQSQHQLSTLHKLADTGVDEIRIDTYPYDVSSSLPASSVSYLNDCLKKAASAGTKGGYSPYHTCFSGRSTYPTWMKSADLGRRCPFHYNHWSCDGGKGGGRNPLCRCRVSIGPWMSLKMHERATQQCHLMHYNPQQYVYQIGRNRRGAKNKTEYDEILRVRAGNNPLSTIK